MLLTIKNETFASENKTSAIIDIENKFLSVREIIEIKIKNEVEEYNKKIENGSSNIEITEFEKKLNSNKNNNTRNKKLLDMNKQIDLGIKAFQNNEYFVIVDDRQVQDLESIVEIKENTDISFVRLSPLIGG